MLKSGVKCLIAQVLGTSAALEAVAYIVIHEDFIDLHAHQPSQQ